MTASSNPSLRQVISADQIQKRIRELGRQISDDYRGETVIALGILENGFMFIADLVRALEVPVVCTFINTEVRGRTTQIAPPRKYQLFNSDVVSGGSPPKPVLAAWAPRRASTTVLSRRSAASTVAAS